MRVSIQVDQREIQTSIEEAVREKQEMFRDDLENRVREALGEVIYGNFRGIGQYNPRPVGTFKSSRFREFRSWVMEKHGSSRARMSGSMTNKDIEARDRQRRLVDNLQRKMLIEYARSRGAVEAEYEQTRMESGSRFRYYDDVPRNKQDSLTKYLNRHRAGRVAARDSRRLARGQANAQIRYGLQTGVLAEAWRDLQVVRATDSSANMGKDGLMLSFAPDDSKRQNGTPDAGTLTGALARQAGTWNGLYDVQQLLAALEDKGIKTSK